MDDLFEPIAVLELSSKSIADGAVLLRGAALPFEREFLAALNDITATSPFRHMVTPSGYTMSVAQTNCGAAGWATTALTQRRAILGRPCLTASST
jgi:alkylated DNA repair protein (DNA oxidative demethylase)